MLACFKWGQFELEGTGDRESTGEVCHFCD